MSLPPLLLLGIDTPIGLAVIRELGRHGVPVHGIGRSADAIGRGSRWLTGFSLRGEGALARWLPARIANTGAAALMAVSEGDLLELAALPAIIGGCRILSPRAGPLAMVLDKPRTLAAAAEIGIDIPASWQPLAADDPLPPGLGWPLVLKWPDPVAVGPRLAAAGLELFKTDYARDEAGLRTILRRTAAVGAFPLVQGYAAGVGLGQMLHMADGRATLRFQHRRLHEWPPEGGVSTLCRAVPLAEHAAQMAKSEALLAALGWKGPAMVEYRFDPAARRYALMEVNGRFWGSQPLATACGAEFAWEQYRRAVLGDTTPAPMPRTGLMARYMGPETKRLLRILFAPSAIPDPAFRARPVRDLASWLLGFVDPRMRAYVFSWRDPGPFLLDLRGMARRLAHRGRRGPAPAPRARSDAGWSSYRPR